MKINIEKIVRADIFCEDFRCLSNNNSIDFDQNKFSIVYGPNGTGKTSLSLVFGQEKDSEYTIEVDDKKHTEKDDKIFHIISDQNGRNIIAGSTEDFILGDNVKREYELKQKLEDGFKTVFDFFSNKLKSNFNIKTKSHQFTIEINDTILNGFVSDIANVKSKGKSINRSVFLSHTNQLTKADIVGFDEKKYEYFISDYGSSDSVIKSFCNLMVSKIPVDKNVQKIEESDDAVGILHKYSSADDCIVCDTKIDRLTLLEKKKNQKELALESITPEAKIILEKIVNKIDGIDPFGIKNGLKTALRDGQLDELNKIINEIDICKNNYRIMLFNMFAENVRASGLIETNNEYETLVKEKPEFESEDIIFIGTFLSECLDRKISLERDSEKNLKLLFDKKEFLNQDRTKLMLSNGEQNFLSLAFELLKAKKSSHKIVVLDDPISSFDSIYKNKIAYSILRILESKKTIILTHSTDLINLLEHQQQKCFKLYYLNNTTDEENGFIFINPEEQKILIYLHEFLAFLRGEIKNHILNEKAFLISIVPFMRGYCQITGDVHIKNELTSLMHGYNTTAVNISEAYNKLFGSDLFIDDSILSALEITEFDIDGIGNILDPTKYPLLNKTLIHTLTYLYLRLRVEKILVEKHSINTAKHSMLSDIIIAAFKRESTNPVDMENRVFFLSRKTLLNEFNHFEINMNIFQPAIDITNQVLHKEKSDILAKLAGL